MRVAIAIALIFLARFTVQAWFDPLRDGDIAWQQWLGLQMLHSGHIPLSLGPEAFTAPGAPWIPQEWALSLLVAVTLGTWRFALLVALTALAGVATLLVTAYAARRMGASTVATSACVLVVAFSMVESYGIRAQVFAWMLLAAMMFVLRCCEGRTRWWIVPLVILWANVHASVLLAPVLLGLWTAGTAIDERAWTPKVRENLLLTLATCAAIFATPLGYRLPFYAIELIQSPIRVFIDEWQPSDLTASSFTSGALVLILAAAIFGVERSRRWSELLLYAAVTWMAFTAVRNVPVCAIVLAPAVAARVTEYVPEKLRINSIFSERSVRALLYLGCFVAAALTVLSLAGSRHFTAGNLPTKAIATLGSIAGTHNLYCEDFAWCSLGLRYSNVREFLDGRCDAFPLAVWHDYETVSATKGNWRSVLDRRGVNAIVVDRKRSLAQALPLWHDWRLVYADDRYRLFLRERSRTAYQQQ